MPETLAPNVEQHLAMVVDRFQEAFGQTPTHAAVAPGRVNLIGEHTDYNDGFVMPMAIERQTVVAARKREDTTARVRSTDVDGEGTFELQPIPLPPENPAAAPWWKYVQGAVAYSLEEGLDAIGFDALLSSTVPAGGGLSSSASIEVAAATLMEALSSRSIDPVRKAMLCQYAEHHFAGTPCGIMDQFISAMGRQGAALLIDCRSSEIRPVPLDDTNIQVLIANSNMAHELSGGEYGERRAQCEAAARAIDVKALRDADMAMLDGARDKIDEVTYRRGRHVIGEIQRCLDAADAMAIGDWQTVGELMFASHASLRDDYEVSTPELDALVEIAQEKVGEGVIGSRMTGGGFGGCTVSLVESDKADAIADHLAEQYKARTGIEASIFVTRPAQGARELTL